MKKIYLTIVLFFVGLTGIVAETISVEFSDCVDGDTAKFTYNNEEITIRFLAIDTPETVHPTKGVEPYGKEASDYTCNSLKEANEIILEYDSDSDKLDKYGRHLVWVFVDDNLLQKKLINEGLASVAYLYGDYKYTDELEMAEQKAEQKKIGIWSDENYNPKDKTDDYSENKSIKDIKEDKDINYKEIIILLGIVILLCMFSAKSRKKVKNKIRSELKKRLK